MEESTRIIRGAAIFVTWLPLLLTPAHAQRPLTPDMQAAPRDSVLAATLTCSPAPCVLPNVQASEGGNSVSETPIASNPVNTAQLLTGADDYNCSTLLGFYASSDGGSTWNHTCLGTISEFFGGGGEPILGYDRKGIAYAGGLNVMSRPLLTVVALASSADNGVTWGVPVEAVSPVFSGGRLDKPWLQIDTSAVSGRVNTLYISTTQSDSNGASSQITVSHSTDGGVTWTTVPVDSVQSYPSVDAFSSLAVARHGTVYVSWMRCLSAGVCGGSTASMMISKSTDGGNSWSAPVVMANVTLVPSTCSCAFYGSLPNTFQPVSDIPSIGIDKSKGTHAGTLYAVMYNWTGTQMQVVVTHSTDAGATWSSPVPVAPPTATHDQFLPWLSVSGSGTVGVSWLDRRRDPSNLSYEAFMALSTTGGVSFGANRQLASALSNPNNTGFCQSTGTCFIGQYTGNTWAGKTFFASWMDSRTFTMQDEVGGFLP